MRLSLCFSSRLAGSTSDCTIEYLDIPTAEVEELTEVVPISVEPARSAVGPAVGAAIVAGIWLVSALCLGDLAAKVFAAKPALARLFDAQPLFSVSLVPPRAMVRPARLQTIASALSCSVIHARAAVAFFYAVCTSTITHAARLATTQAASQ